MTTHPIDTSSRGLKTQELRAALLANRQPSLEEVAALPTVMQEQKTYKLPLTCQYTGVNCGMLILPTVAGYMPLLGQWKQQQVLHPLFSLEQTPLLQFSKNTWLRFCGFSQEEAADAVLTQKQEQMLQIACLALLHKLTDVKQEVPWLPDFVEVQNNCQSLIHLTYWKAYLDSKRFSFPTIRVSKQNNAIDLKAFLQTCWDTKKSYETSIAGMADEQQLDLAEAALLAIRNELAGKRPTSERLLWKWFVANLPSRYSKDAAPDGWMHELFTAKGSNIFDFTKADINLFEEIFLSECPTGTSVSHAFLSVLASKKKLLENHFEAFEIIVPQDLQIAADSGEIPLGEPLLADFPKKVFWMIAHAKWKLTHGSVVGAARIHREAAAAQQNVVTVHASHIPPPLDTGRARDFENMEELESYELDELTGSSLLDSVETEHETEMESGEEE